MASSNISRILAMLQSSPTGKLEINVLPGRCIVRFYIGHEDEVFGEGETIHEAVQDLVNRIKLDTFNKTGKIVLT